VPDIHIVRDHSLGLPQARQLAFRWAEVAEQKLQMECTYVEGAGHDVLAFKRAGASGELKVTADQFELEAKLGLLLGMFKGKIETEIMKNLDELLAEDEPLKAFEQGVAKHEARRAAKAHAAKVHAKAPTARKAK
jgi:putative polyhydroxyalkanoate system protein